MPQFKRTIRFLLFIIGTIVGSIAAIAAVFARRMITPPRFMPWSRPDELGLPYEGIQFPAVDGLRIAGWFIPAAVAERKDGATVILVHGWSWNRLGNRMDDPIERMIGASEVDLLRLAHSLHHAGYNVVMYDQRNHGESAQAGPSSFGVQESSDLLGALNYLRNRADVNTDRIGVIGFSSGANATLFALPQTNMVGAAVVVQPTSIKIFNEGFSDYMLGPISRPVALLTEQFYQAAGGMSFDAIEPMFAVADAGDTPILYVQGDGDPWGTVGNVTQMAAATPNAHPLIVDTQDRYGGYQYIVDNPAIAISFFDEHLGGDA